RSAPPPRDARCLLAERLWSERGREPERHPLWPVPVYAVGENALLPRPARVPSVATSLSEGRPRPLFRMPEHSIPPEEAASFPKPRPSGQARGQTAHPLRPVLSQERATQRRTPLRPRRGPEHRLRLRPIPAVRPRAARPPSFEPGCGGLGGPRRQHLPPEEVPGMVAPRLQLRQIGAGA